MDLLGRLHKAYDTHDRLRYELTRCDRTPLEECFSDTPIPPEELTLTTLQEYTKNDNAWRLCRLLQYIPPKVIFDSCGEDLLLWTWTQCSGMETSERLRKGIAELTGRDEILLEKARLEQWQLYYNHDTQNIMRKYNLFDTFKDNTMQKPDLERVLRSNARPDVILSPARVKDYAIVGAIPEKTYNIGFSSKWGRLHYENPEGTEVYLDGPLGFVLTYKGKPNAVISFSTNEDRLRICQWQGLRARKLDTEGASVERNGHARGLMPLDWIGALVRYTEDWATIEGFAHIIVQGAKQNRWTRPNEYAKDIHLPIEKARSIYNKNAVRLGYRPARDGNFHKKIE